MANYKEAPQGSPEHAGNLQRYLLVPRKPRGFKEVDGWVEPVTSHLSTSIKPVVTVDVSYADLVGLRSGKRSGLLSVESVRGEKAIKVKGCRILSALSKKAEGPYRRAHIFLNGATGNHPEGGHTLSAVHREIDNTLFFNKLLTAEGFPVPHEPFAIIHYGKMFEPDGRSEYAEELAASVMHVKGDTRLAELYRLKAIDVKASQRVAHRLGLIAGAQKRITNGFYWQGSASTGNYVVFLEGNQLRLGPVDFEDTSPYASVDVSGERQYLSTRFFDQPSRHGLRQIAKELALSPAPDLETRVLANIFGSMYRSSLATVEGERTPLNSTAQYTAPGYFTKEFVGGFKVGYKDPDKREPITLVDLRVAYGLAV